jgi:hypothetical protein
MSKYANLDQELKAIDTGDAIDAIDRLIERGLSSTELPDDVREKAEDEQKALNDAFRREYPALQEMAERIVDRFIEEIPLTRDETKALESGVSLALIGFQEIVAYDKLPNLD